MKALPSKRFLLLLLLAVTVAAVTAASFSASRAAQRRFEKKECLDCHTPFAQKIAPLKSTHPGVKDKDCESCHKIE